jgi:hypothetical protein
VGTVASGVHAPKTMEFAARSLFMLDSATLRMIARAKL